MALISGRIGSMSYNIRYFNNYSFVEGVEFIQSKYPYYDKDILEDIYTGNKYSIQMIDNSIKGILKLEEILDMVIFDVLIGNSDRHHSNWGIKYRVIEDEYNNSIELYDGLCPLYDNGSSLCAYEDPNNVEIFFKDKMKFEALINTKSRSAIGWENQKPIRQFELLKKVKETYYDLTVDFIKDIKNNINEDSISNILEQFSDNIINQDMKKLIKKFIMERRKRMLDIYDLKDEV